MNAVVFISHAQEDSQTASEVCRALESAGIGCWIAPRDILPGEDWPDAIARGVRDSTVVVAVFSSHTNSSRHVKSEIRAAFDRNKTIVPFRIHDVLPEAGFDHLMGNANWIDAYEPPIERRISELVQLLQPQLKDQAPRSVAGARERARSTSSTQSANSSPGSPSKKSERAFPFWPIAGGVVVASALATALFSSGALNREPRSAGAGSAPSSSADSVSSTPPQSFLVAAWAFEGVELASNVRIEWTINGDSTTSYRFLDDKGVLLGTSSSTWTYADGLMYEVSADGRVGRSLIKRISDNAFELTIVDNDVVEYRGLKRLYRRRIRG